jgi:phage portal protein BeeE
MSAFIVRETLQAHVLLWGNAYAEIERDNANRSRSRCGRSRRNACDAVSRDRDATVGDWNIGSRIPAAATRVRAPQRHRCTSPASATTGSAAIR